MSEAQFYNRVDLAAEAKRYFTNPEKLELLYRELGGLKRLLTIGLGARMITTLFALAEEVHGIDINQGSIDRAEEFIKTWKRYVHVQPFETEFDFLEKIGREPRFGKHHFYLMGDVPPGLDGTFDSEIALELFLHLTPGELRKVLADAGRYLKPKGKLVFTIYPSGYYDSLDENFCELSSETGMERKDFIEDGTINIEKLAEQLRIEMPNLFSASEEKYWLDLKGVKVFREEDIEQMCAEAGFAIKEKAEIKGGMFSFARRYVYVAING